MHKLFNDKIALAFFGILNRQIRLGHIPFHAKRRLSGVSLTGGTVLA